MQSRLCLLRRSSMSPSERQILLRTPFPNFRFSQDDEGPFANSPRSLLLLIFRPHRHDHDARPAPHLSRPRRLRPSHLENDGFGSRRHSKRLSGCRQRRLWPDVHWDGTGPQRRWRRWRRWRWRHGSQRPGPISRSVISIDLFRTFASKTSASSVSQPQNTDAARVTEFARLSSSSSSPSSAFAATSSSSTSSSSSSRWSFVDDQVAQPRRRIVSILCATFAGVYATTTTAAVPSE